MPKTARVTGFSPYNKNQIDNSKFVSLRRKEEDDEYIKKRKERSRLDINGTIINTSSFIDKIIDRLVLLVESLGLPLFRNIDIHHYQTIVIF